MQKTKNLFSGFTTEKISEQTAEEIENNLQEFFRSLLVWKEEREEKTND